MRYQGEDQPTQKIKKNDGVYNQNSTRARQKPKQCSYQSKQLEALKVWKAEQLGLLNRFKNDIKKQAQRNRQSLKKTSLSIAQANNLKQIDQIGYFHNFFQSTSSFLSDLGILNKSITDWNSLVQTNFGFLCNDLIQSKKNEKKLIICLNYCLQSIWDQVTKSCRTAQDIITKNYIKEIGFGVDQKLDQLLLNLKQILPSIQDAGLNKTNISQDYADLNEELQSKLMRMSEEKKQLKSKNLELTIKLQYAKERMKQQISFAKERLQEEMHIAKDRLKQEINNSREQREALKLELFQTKERLILQFKEARQRLKGQLFETKEMLNAEKAKCRQEIKKGQQERLFFRTTMHTLEVETAKLQMAKEKLQEEISNAKEESGNLKTEMENTKQMLQMKIDMVKAENSSLIVEKKKLQNTQQNLYNQIYSFNHVIAALQQQVQFLKNAPPSNNMTCCHGVAVNNLFHGKLLAEAIAEKSFLIKSIENHIDKRIVMSEKLYDYRRDKNVNFHQFIDEQQSLVLIVKTQNALIACYYSGHYNKELLMQEEALIISLDHNKVYRLNNLKNYPDKNPQDNCTIQGMIYSNQFLIFGNSQVSIPSNQAIILSNFGASNCFFNSEGFSVGDLLNEGNNNKMDIINYQIHKAILEDKSFEDNVFEFQSSS